jgi:hypothetical protein
MYISIYMNTVYSYKYLHMLLFQYIYIQAVELKENRNFYLFAANRKRKFVFLGRQSKNSNQRLLFQQTCPSMLSGHQIFECLASF